METESQTWGWAGSVEKFLALPLERWTSALSAHLVSLLGRGPSGSQLTAWTEEHAIMSEALRNCLRVLPNATTWSVIFEYELPMEGGRRPDVVLLEGSAVVVLEFKTGAAVRAADTDQASAYGRDLADYHKASHGRVVTPMVVLTNAGTQAYVAGDDVVHTGPDALPRYLAQLEREGTIDLDEWLDSPYEPLPTLVAAAKRIFQHEPLPHVWTALSAGIPQALEYLLDVCRQAEAENGRSLAFITGVPGAGKTLVGLRLVYEGSTVEGRATFLSGNGRDCCTVR